MGVRQKRGKKKPGDKTSEEEALLKELESSEPTHENGIRYGPEK